MTRIIDASLPIVIDTREQRPYRFPGAIRATLKTGDYSILGFESDVCVERKSLTDLFGTVGRGRARFRRECERMSAFVHAAIVIEANLGEVLVGPELSKMNPSAVANTLVAWSIRYGINVWLAGNRQQAKSITYRILQHYHRLLTEG